eukprot:CAMPEP_0195053608 /NCGR_PEP_ID=MMETSP0448-20130528/2673_1 /TAXON_ID=66468 /ORGANISM="Heterocapsa triquestra, Strain CCMP 448" /LENGTH=69 /DNA_ID=CAMNT_0040082917 /DNA_START=194 /DNA_END=399 /DNA_ORIENTATION=-
MESGERLGTKRPGEQGSLADRSQKRQQQQGLSRHRRPVPAEGEHIAACALGASQFRSRRDGLQPTTDTT